MGITKFWIYGRKSRSVNNCSQRSDFGLLGLILDKSSLQLVRVLLVRETDHADGKIPIVMQPKWDTW